MGTDTDGNADGNGKPKGKSKQHMRKPFVPTIKHAKFEGASSDLKGYVFDIMQSKMKQIDKYNSTLDQIKTYIGTHMDNLVLESIEDLNLQTLTEPVPVTQADGTINKIDIKKMGKAI